MMHAKMHTSRLERVMTALDRGTPDQVPVVPTTTNFALRNAGYKYADAIKDPEKWVAAQMKALHDLDVDAVWGLNAATGAVGEAVGGNTCYWEDNPPAPGEPAINSFDDVERAVSANITNVGKVPLVLQSIRALRKAVGNEVPIFSLAPSPYSLADWLRGAQNFYKDFIRDPKFAHALLEACVPPAIEFGLAALEAGADVIWTPEPLCGATCISKKHYREFNYPYNKRMFAALRDQGARVVYHICGDWNDRLELAADGVDCLHVSIEADIARVKAEFGHRVSVMGNVRSVDFIYGSAEDIEKGSADCVGAAKSGGGFILSSDCGMPRDTSAENVRAMISVARRDGVY